MGGGKGGKEGRGWKRGIGKQERKKGSERGMEKERE